MKVKVSEASGIVLDWLVRSARGDAVTLDDEQWICIDGIADMPLCAYTPSTDGAQAVPIIEREKITADYFPDGGHPDGGAWLANTPAYQTDAGVPLHEEFGPTFLIAAMRCYVASKLDDEVEVPDELA